MNIYSHHKCGTRWTIEYLRRLSDLNGLSLETSDVTNYAPAPGSDIKYWGNAAYACLAPTSAPFVHIIRNPLSVIVSAYYSHLHSHPTIGWAKLAQQRSVLTSTSKTEGLYLTLAFLEQHDFFPNTVGPLYALRTWDWRDDRMLTLRMEDLVKEPSRTIRAIPGITELRLPPDEDFRFEVFAGGRRLGEAVPQAHYRSGRSDDWKDELPPALVNYCRWTYEDVLRRYYPDVLEP